MSTGRLTRPAELDDIEVQLKDITGRVVHLFDEPTWQERIDEVNREFAYTGKRLAAAILIVACFAAYFVILGHYAS